MQLEKHFTKQTPIRIWAKLFDSVIMMVKVGLGSPPPPQKILSFFLRKTMQFHIISDHYYYCSQRPKSLKTKLS